MAYVELVYVGDTVIGEPKGWEPAVEASDYFVVMDLPFFTRLSMILQIFYTDFHFFTSSFREFSYTPVLLCVKTMADTKQQLRKNFQTHFNALLTYFS